jgi:hypothetical protein
MSLKATKGIIALTPEIDCDQTIICMYTIFSNKGRLTPRRDEKRRCAQILHRATQNILYLLHEKIHISLWEFRYVALRSAPGTSRRLAAQRDVSRSAVTHGVQERRWWYDFKASSRRFQGVSTKAASRLVASRCELTVTVHISTTHAYSLQSIMMTNREKHESLCYVHPSWRIVTSMTRDSCGVRDRTK